MYIENEHYYISFDCQGGEMKEWMDKQTGIQILYQGDSEYWKGKNPTLFPIIGNTYTKQYVIDHQTYQMKNHGFLRNSQLIPKKYSATKFGFQLESNEETLQVYPFQFAYEIIYELIGKKLSIHYTVTNQSKRAMPFQLGAHPGFKLPLYDDETFEDYAVVFEKKENMTQVIYDIHGKNPMQYHRVEMKELPLSYDIFEKYGTLIYKDIQSNYISIIGKHYQLKVTFDQFPYLALWTPKEGAPFLCVEPWMGHGDLEPVDVSFYDRVGTHILEEQELFEIGYEIEPNFY